MYVANYHLGTLSKDTRCKHEQSKYNSRVYRANVKCLFKCNRRTFICWLTAVLTVITPLQKMCLEHSMNWISEVINSECSVILVDSTSCTIITSLLLIFHLAASFYLWDRPINEDNTIVTIKSRVMIRVLTTYKAIKSRWTRWVRLTWVVEKRNGYRNFRWITWRKETTWMTYVVK